MVDTSTARECLAVDRLQRHDDARLQAELPGFDEGRGGGGGIRVQAGTAERVETGLYLAGWGRGKLLQAGTPEAPAVAHRTKAELSATHNLQKSLMARSTFWSKNAWRLFIASIKTLALV